MKEENWITNINKVNLWLEEEDRGASGQAIGLSITLGNDCGSDDMRSTYWTAIRSIGSTYTDFPLARKGQASTLPVEIQVAVDGVTSAVQSAFADITNGELITTVIYAGLGRRGGKYSSMNEFADYMAKQAGQNLLKGYKEGRWDGTMNGDIPTMAAPPVKEKKEANKED